MSNPSWPASLPDCLLQSSYSYTPANNVVESKNDTGPSFRRLRSSAVPQPFTGSIIVDKTQYTTLKSFYFDTLYSGVLPFDWKDPMTGDPATLRFDVSQPYQLTNRGGKWFEVQLSLEIMP